MAPDHFPENRETAIVRIEEGVVAEIDEPLGGGGIHRGAAGHRDSAIGIAESSAHAVFVHDGRQGGDEIDGWCSLAVGYIRKPALDDEARYPTVDEHVIGVQSSLAVTHSNTNHRAQL